VRQTRRRDIDSGASYYPMLDRNVVEVIHLNVSCGFNLNQPPSLISTALEYIDSDEYAMVLERAFEDRWNFRIRD